MEKPIVLASASPRRRELLEQIGLKFTVDASNDIEVFDAELLPHDLVCKISLAKARAVAKRHPDSIVIAADTFGVLHGKVIGKPESAADAKRILKLLSGRNHQVITGFTVIDTATGTAETQWAETKVFFRNLSEAEIDSYIASGEPMDKAAAYGIQGKGALLVGRIEGDYYNVVGLPLVPLVKTLRRFGAKVLE